MKKEDIEGINKYNNDYCEGKNPTLQFYNLLWEWLCEFKKDFNNKTFGGDGGSDNGYIL